MATNKAEIAAVFAYWVAKCRNSGRGRPPVLGDKRKRVIKKAIDMYGFETCMQAIDGVLASDFHQGANPRGMRYDDITLILRDEKHIEMFADMADDPMKEWLNE